MAKGNLLEPWITAQLDFRITQVNRSDTSISLWGVGVDLHKSSVC